MPSVTSTIEKNIRPFSEYKQPKEKVYIINKKIFGHELLFIGIFHSVPPRKNDLRLIEKRFKEFIQRNKKGGVIAVPEAFSPIPRRKSVEELMSLFMEAGYLVLLSEKMKVGQVSVEPTFSEVLQYVLKKRHKKIHVGIWMFLNFLLNSPKDGVLTQEEIHNIFTFIDAQLGIFKKKSSTEERLALFSSEINKIVKKNVFPKHTITESLHFKGAVLKELRNLETPFSEKTPINKVAIEFNKAKDVHVASKLLELLKTKNVFCVYGITHAISQEPAFEKYE